MGFIDKFFDIRSTANPEKAVAAITEGVPVRGYNMWLLICSSVLASIGLDTGSSAVIIGAMLISPLMSPILGVGLSFGIHDKTLLISSLKNFLAAVVLSLISSVLYFSVSPFAHTNPEIEARTYPTLLDVLVALFGGIAGIVSATRPGSSTAIPGVAIATALMPPLCVAGYGLSSGQWAYFGGAFYLFFINAVFISLATYWIVRYLHFPKRAFVSNRQRKYYLIIFTISSIVITVPSIYFLYTVYQKQAINARLKTLVINPISSKGNEILKWELLNLDTATWVKVYHSGNPLKDSLEGAINENLEKSGMASYKLKSIRVNMTKDEVNQLSAEVSRQMFQQLQIENRLAGSNKVTGDTLPVFQINREIRSAFPFVSSVTGGWFVTKNQSDSNDSIPLIFWKSTTGKIRLKDETAFRDFLKARLSKDSILLVRQ